MAGLLCAVAMVVCVVCIFGMGVASKLIDRVRNRWDKAES